LAGVAARPFSCDAIAVEAKERKIRNDRVSDFFRYYFIIIFATSGVVHRRPVAGSTIVRLPCVPPISVTTEEASRERERERERESERRRLAWKLFGNNNRTDFNGYCTPRFLLVLLLMLLQLLYIFPISSGANFRGTARHRLNPSNYYPHFGNGNCDMSFS
jgi:hypothetical protein